MDAWKLLVGSDLGLMSLATIVLVIVIAVVLGPLVVGAAD